MQHVSRDQNNHVYHCFHGAALINTDTQTLTDTHVHTQKKKHTHRPAAGYTPQTWTRKLVWLTIKES